MSRIRWAAFTQQQIAIYDLTVVFLAAVLLVFALMLFLYESFLTALLILSMQLLAVLAVFIGLWVTGTERDITAMMGMTMIIGIVTEIAIFYFSEFTELEGGPAPRRCPSGGEPAAADRHDHHRRDPGAAAAGAGHRRGRGPAAPLAIAIISGLLVQMPLVLFVMPVLYSLLIRRDE